MRSFESPVTKSEDEQYNVVEDVQEAAQYRVRVNLERFFIDERARCYMWVSASRRVRWLAARLRRVFALPAALALMSRGHLLPPAEPLAVLAPDDPIEVIPIAESRHMNNSGMEEIQLGGGDVIDSSLDLTAVKRLRLASEEADELDQMKRHALHLLDAVAGAGPPARRPRRRVRRRRPLLAASTHPASPVRPDATPAPGPAPEPRTCRASPARPVASPAAGPAPEPRVRRSLGARSREPRVVPTLVAVAR